MGNEICWLKRDGNFLTASSTLLSSAMWKSLESLGARCVESGHEALGESLAGWAREIEFFATTHGALATSGQGHAQCAIQTMAEERVERMRLSRWSNEYFKSLEIAFCVIKKEAPQSWLDETVWLVSYARKSIAVAQLEKNSLPAGKASIMLEASMAGAAITDRLPQMEQANVVIKKLARLDKWGIKAGMELQMFEKVLCCFGKKMQYAERVGDVEVIKDEGRFCAKKAYAMYLPERGSRREGFVGAAIGELGADLGAAKLYESIDRAQHNLDRSDHDGAALVEIEIRVSGIHGPHPKETGNGLLEALSQHESNEMKLMMARADIERMKQRVKELESLLGIEAKAEVKSSKPKRSL